MDPVGNSPLHRNRNFAAVGGHLKRGAGLDVVMVCQRNQRAQIQFKIWSRSKCSADAGESGGVQYAREKSTAAWSRPVAARSGVLSEYARNMVQITRQK